MLNLSQLMVRYSISLTMSVSAVGELNKPPPSSRPEFVKPMSWVGIVPPDPMSPTDLDRYDQMLILSPEQQQVYGRLRDDYETFCASYITEVVQPMWTRAGDASTIEGAARFQAIDSLAEERSKALQTLRSRETALFDALATVLAEAQQLNLAIVMLDRERELTKPDTFAVPEARPDLVTIMLALKIPFVGENVAIENHVSEYIQAVVPALRAADAANSQVLRKDNAILAEYVELQKRQEAGWEVRGTALLEERADHHKQCVSKYKAIRDINRRFLPLMIAALPPNDGLRLRDAYRQSSYPAVYPDAQSAADDMAHARTIASLTNEQRAAVDELEVRFNNAYEALARKLHQSIEDWRMVAFTAPQIHNDVRAEYEKKTADLTAERTALNTQYRTHLVDLLTPEQAAMMPPQPDPRQPRREPQ